MESSGTRRGQGLRRAGAAALAALLVVVAGCGGKDEAGLIASAKQYLEKRDAKAAVIELKNALEKNPQSGEARLLLGQALLESGDPVGADVELRRALDYKQPESAVVPLRAKALLALSQNRKLVEDYGSLELPDPLVNIELQVSLAQAYAALGARDEARSRVDRALAISSVYAPAVLLDARLKAAGGNIDAALAATDALLAKSPDNADALQFKADVLMSARNDRAGAVALYRKAVEQRPDLYDAQVAIFGAALADRDTEGATRQAEVIKKLRPAHPRTRFVEAQLAYAQGNFKQARELLLVLMRSAPENSRVLQLTGAVEFQLGSLSQAEASLSRALQLTPQATDARRLLAEIYLRNRQPDKALATLKPALEQKTKSAELLALAAQAHLLEGDAKIAQDLFAEAARMKPDDKRLNAAVALTQISKDSDGAFTELQRLAAADQGRAVDLALITARLQRREFDGALAAIAALEAKQPASPIAGLLRGQVMVAKNDVAAARKAFEAALAKDPKYLPGVAALAALDLQAKQPEAADKRFAALVALDPKSARARIAYADLKKRLGAPAADIAKLYAEAVAADPADVQARLLHIDHLARSKDTQAAALNAAQTALSAMPNNVDILERMGRIQFTAGEKQQALSSFSKLAAARPDRASGHLGAATVQLAGGDQEAALRSARKAVEAEPESIPANRMLISLQLQAKQPQKAIESARALQKRRPEDSIGFIAEGDVEAAQKRWDPALVAYRAALQKNDPGVAPMRVHATLVATQKAADASKFADGWLKGHPADQAFRFHLGDTSLAAGDLAQAEARYLDVLKSQPEHALALNNVAWLKMRQKKPGALEFAERAVKAAPNQPPLMDTLAMVLSADGKHARAVEVQKEVVAKAPQMAGYRLNLARIQLAAGDKAQARKELDTLAGLKDFPGQADVRLLQKQLDGG